MLLIYFCDIYEMFHISYVVKFFLIFLNFSNRLYIIFDKILKKISVTFIYNLTTFFEFDQKTFDNIFY